MATSTLVMPTKMLLMLELSRAPGSARALNMRLNRKTRGFIRLGTGGGIRNLLHNMQIDGLVTKSISAYENARDALPPIYSLTAIGKDTAALQKSILQEFV